MQTERLLRRAQAGDPAALDTLVREYYPQILRYCRWHLPDVQLAQDAAQETFLKAVRWLDGWRELVRCQAKLLGWKAWAMESIAALALYAVGRELGLWDAAWSLRNLLFGLTALAMCTALLGLPFLCKASQYKMLELERATRAGVGGPLLVRFLLLLAGEVVLLAVLAVSVYAAAPLKLGQLVCLLAVPFLLANNELLLLLRRVRPEKLVLVAVPLFAGQLVLLRLVQGPDLPPFLPLTAGVLAVCMGGQCAKLAARTEYTVEA